jgi:hypothetical protein
MKAFRIAAGLMIATAASRAAHLAPAPQPSPSVSGNVASLPYDFSDLKEPALFWMLNSTDRFVRISAFAAIKGRWKKQLEKGAFEKEKGQKEELDKDMQRLFRFLENKSDTDNAISAARTLAFTPPDRAHRAVVKKHLQTAVTSSKEVWVQAHSADSLRNLFWVRGEGLDEESVEIIDKFLKECRDPGALYWFLWLMSDMGSDCLPFKATLEKIRGSADPQSAATAKTLLQNLSRQIDASERKKTVFMTLPD